MTYDYLIVGQGLAGSILSIKLLEKGKTLKVVNTYDLPSSSMVAGGMFNPVTGKHLAKTWLAETLFDTLHHFYADLETKFQANFLNKTTVYRPFINTNQQQQFINTLEKHDLSGFASAISHPTQYDEILKSNLGGISIRQAGWLDTPVFLNAVSQYLLKNECLLNENLNLNHLQHNDDGVVYQNDTYKHVVFCEGFHATKNALWSWLPFNPVKGETLIASFDHLALTEIINQNAWIIPLGNKLFRIGATYSWHDLNFENTPEAKEKLLLKLQDFLQIYPEKIIDHQAGVRPSTKDRRPFLGKHPQFENYLIFNGLGTKGVSLAPFMADCLVDFMLNGKELPEETTIERFYALY